MYSIDLLVDEHTLIVEFTLALRKECEKILDGKELDTSIFRQGIEFSRIFADKHHHQKEEKVLFRVMMEKLGPIATQLIRGGMMVEHDLGRLHVATIEEALNEYEKNPNTDSKLEIISNAICYGNLLRRHIEKEDAAVYTFAERNLSKDDKDLVDRETKNYEDKSNSREEGEKLLSKIKGKIYE